METKNEIHMYVLTQEQINQIAAIAGKEAVQTFRAEQAKVEKKRAREENKVFFQICLLSLLHSP